MATPKALQSKTINWKGNVMSEAVESRRRGGRAARRELRAAPIPEDKRAVQPGMKSGAFSVLSDRDKDRIHEASLTILEEVGLAEAIPSCIEMVTEAGGKLTDEGRLLFPRGLISDVLEKKGRHRLYCGGLRRAGGRLR